MSESVMISSTLYTVEGGSGHIEDVLDIRVA